jgi:hypothetical protein
VGKFEAAGLHFGLKIKIYEVGTTAFRNGAPNLASLGKIIHIVSDHVSGD